MMRPTTVFLLAAALAAIATPARAQLGVAVGGGGALGNYEATSAGMDRDLGPAFTAAVEYALRPRLSLYAGYSHARFGCEDGFCSGLDVQLTAQGLDAGIRFEPGWLSWVRLGLVRYTLDVDPGAGDRVPNAVEHLGPGLGYRAGTGLSLRLSNRIALLPGVEYRRFDSGGHATALASAGVEVRVWVWGG